MLLRIASAPMKQNITTNADTAASRKSSTFTSALMAK
jgi:hypothetical protein